MNRRTVLTTLGTTAAVALGGCVSEGDDQPGTEDGNTDDPSATDSGAGTVVEYFDMDPDRPECEKESETVEVEHGDETREHETAATIPYPPEPEGYDETDIVTFVEKFDRAYVRHDVLCRRRSGRILTVGYSVARSETYDWKEDITHVFVLRAAGATAGLDSDGYMWQAELGYSAVVYAVDETGVARTDFDDVSRLEPDEFEAHSPDPLEEGRLVAQFE